MKHIKTIIAVFGVGALLSGLFSVSAVLAQSAAQPSVVTTGSKFTANTSRPCMFAAGGWTTIDSDNSGANLSGAMTTWSTYVIQCTSDAYIAWGGATAAADSSDAWIAAGAWVRFITTDDSNYVSVLNTTHATNDCHYIECR
jgi:hypothetical protein